MSTEYGRRLRRAREHAGLTQVQLSKLTGIPQSTISTAERKGHSSLETAQYAKACGVDVHWLATGEGEMVPSILTSKVKFSLAPGEHADTMEALGAVPLLTWEEAKPWSSVDAPPRPENATWLPCPAEHGPRAYALRVQGESMFNPTSGPSYAEGDFIFVDPDRQARTGDRVVIALSEQPAATFKQLVVEDGRTMLKALNPDWRPRYIDVDEDAHLCGVVIGRWTPE